MSRYTKRTRYTANESIRDSELQVIGADGENLGVLSRADALKKAEELELDLVLISTKTTPSIAKIVDLSKYKYDQQKKESEQRKGKKVELKELQFKPNIDPNDLNVRIRRAKKFLAQGNRVKFTVKFFGRLKNKKDLGREKMDVVMSELEGIGEIENGPKFEGNFLVTQVKPVKRG